MQQIAFEPGLEKIAKLSRLLREGMRYAFATLRRVSILGNLGIAPRLGIAFVAVAVLAAAANSIVEHSAALVVQPTAAPPTAMAVRPIEPAPGQLPAPAVVPARAVVSDDLILALDRFDRAARAHFEAGTDVSAANTMERLPCALVRDVSAGR